MSTYHSQSESNLSNDELAGLKSLRNRIKDGSLVIADTDKSHRFCTLTRDQYLASGEKHTSKDIEILPSQVKRIQNCVNDHVHWFRNIMRIGSNFGHEDRMAKNTIDKGEQDCQMVLLIKDHKGWVEESNEPPPSRPVVSGNTGLNCHLSELLSHIIEPITAEAPGNEIDSTAEMLHIIEQLNEKLLSFESEHDLFQIPNVPAEPSVSTLPAEPSINSDDCLDSKRSKKDIRFYGKEGAKLKGVSELNRKKDISSRVDKLRYARSENLIPNLLDRVNAGYLIDEIENGKPIDVPPKLAKKKQSRTTPTPPPNVRK